MYLDGALRGVDVEAVRIHSLLDVLENLSRGTRQGAPTCGEHRDELDVIGREAVQEFDRHNLAEASSRKHDSREGQLDF